MNEGFEFTLHALKSPAFGRFFAGFHPVCGRLLAPWVAGRRLVGLELLVMVRGRREREAKEEEWQQQKVEEDRERAEPGGSVVPNGKGKGKEK